MYVHEKYFLGMSKLLLNRPLGFTVHLATNCPQKENFSPLNALGY